MISRLLIAVALGATALAVCSGAVAELVSAPKSVGKPVSIEARAVIGRAHVSRT